MVLFGRKKEPGVRSFILKLVNNNCPELKALIEGPRNDSRVNLVTVVMVVPVEKEQLQLPRTFMAVTKEFSSTGVALVLDQQRALDQVILGFRFEGEMTFVRATARHLSPMGGGFYQLGFYLQEVVSLGDYPELEMMSF